MDQGPGPQGAPREGKAEDPQQDQVQSVQGRGRVVLIRECWRHEDSSTTLENFLEQAPPDPPAGPSSSGAPSCHSSASKGARRRLKRCGDEGWTCSSDCPAAKSQRCSEEPRHAERKAAATGPREAPEAWPATPASAREEVAAADARAPGGPPPQPRVERGEQLLLVMCRASTLSTQLPRLQLLLRQVRARDRRPPAALVGVVVQPQPDEEAEARRRLESLLCSVFAPHGAAVEVHTAVFCPSRPEGALDVRRAAPPAHGGRLVDRATQTDGEEHTVNTEEA
ncbi:uncharacterized protein C2orf72 [Oryctolagus cuniculus]|uniref:uncharacterized protein C2orf72 n=1 Tax=Oryctolagus cuniculus TaxID=9986 RepID=UPI00222EFE3C|nr:uncharacterized protein LOC127491554 [Oryctolagus cuniculus]